MTARRLHAIGARTAVAMVAILVVAATLGLFR